MAMLSDGSFIAAGSVYDFNSGQRDFAAVHVLVNGGIDSSFGQQGFAQIDLGGDNESANAVLVQPDGMLVLAGKYHNSNTSQDDFAVTRLTSNGAPDTSFGNAGMVFTDFAGDFDQANSAACNRTARSSWLARLGSD